MAEIMLGKSSLLGEIGDYDCSSLSNGLLLQMMRKTRNMSKIELLYKNVGSND
jgi:hypothetical protein